MKFEIIKGDLIQKALAGEFDVIAHGCNCFCIQGAGIAVQMSKVFDTNDYTKYLLESPWIHKGDFNKLGQIEYCLRIGKNYPDGLRIVNCYTQYQPGKNLDYEALTLCMRKINHEFKGKHIGLPKIGCGLAGGIWDIMELPTELAKIQFESKHFKDVKTIIKEELKDCNVTICEL